jgi:hypothetical protein
MVTYILLMTIFCNRTPLGSSTSLRSSKSEVLVMPDDEEAQHVEDDAANLEAVLEPEEVEPAAEAEAQAAEEAEAGEAEAEAPEEDGGDGEDGGGDGDGE